MKISGVYAIRCEPTGKMYVGSAVDINGRWACHVSYLKRNVHKNAHLQSAWNKYGPEKFTWHILSLCCQERLVSDEQDEIDRYKSSDRNFGFNLSPTAGNTLGCRFSDEARKKISLALIGRIGPNKGKPGRKATAIAKERMSLSRRGVKKSPEHRAAISAAWTHEARARQAARMIGSKLSDEARLKVSASKLGKPLSEEHKASISKALSGRKQSPESIAKSSASRRGKKRGPYKRRALA